MNNFLFSLFRVPIIEKHTSSFFNVFSKSFLCCLFSFSIFQIQMDGQVYCPTAGGGNAVGALPQGECFVDYSGPYNIKVYVHVVRKGDGNGGFTDGQTDAAIQSAFSILESDFAPHNIFFVRSCQVENIITAKIGYEDFDLYCSLWNDPDYDHDDGISIFFGPPITYSGVSGGGFADGILSNKIWIAGQWPGYGNAVESPLISHAMGHALGLYHTYHGTVRDGARFAVLVILTLTLAAN